MTEQDELTGWADGLAERLAVLVLRRTQVPLTISVLHQEIFAHLHRIVLAPGGSGELRAVSGAFGAWLAEIGASGDDAVRSILHTLGVGVLGRIPGRSAAIPDPADGVEVLAAVAAGYSEAIRQATFEQQEHIKRALVEARKEAERDLYASETRFGAVFASAAVGIAITDLTGVVVHGNPALHRIVGRSEAELRDLSIFELFPPEDVDVLRADYRALISAPIRHSRFSRNTQVRLPDEDTNWVELSVALLRDQSGAADHYATIFADVSDLYLLAQRLKLQTLHDMVTGRPNRQYLVSRLEQVLGRDTERTPCWLYQVDLDDFSTPNFRLGRAAGDRLLRVVADRLETFARGEQDMLARSDGDQFLLLVEPSGVDPLDLAARVCTAIHEPVELTDISLPPTDTALHLTASIGVAVPEPGSEPEALLGQADHALRRAKQLGGAQCIRFTPDPDPEPEART